ncbi:MAG TPA: HAMP domain-containing sensor histidine kinase, partial [Candidatus Paceibacterota bacterium]
RVRRQEVAYLEQKAEFLSIASHEIRTPLTGIRWAIEGLLKRENPPLHSKTRTVLALVHESCLGLIGRVNNLLDLTALEGKKVAFLRPEEIAIAPFLEDIADSLALSAQQRNVAIVLDASVRSAGTLTGDRQMLHHAFFNLLSNAVKYTREGTSVRVSYAQENGGHVFQVRDEGAGVRPEDRERIFSGYHRTKEAIRSGAYGTGLGLYLVKKAAELHNGSIAVSGNPGEGATFTLQIR